jgi:hypothetical protein
MADLDVLCPTASLSLLGFAANPSLLEPATSLPLLWSVTSLFRPLPVTSLSLLGSAASRARPGSLFRIVNLIRDHPEAIVC